MPDKSEVIMGQMEETRQDLAEKLETLEQKIVGTVGAVTETVESVKDSITETVATVTDTVEQTVESVSESVESTVESVKGFFDIPAHVRKRPWLMLGGSVLLGFLGGRLLTPRSREEERESPPTYQPTYTAAPPAREERPAPPAAAEPEEEGWLTRLGDQMGGELDKLKGLALGALFGVARDMVSQWVPESLKQQVTEVMNDFTTNLGGKVVEGPVLEQLEPEQPAQQPAEGGRPERTENGGRAGDAGRREKVGGRGRR